MSFKFLQSSIANLKIAQKISYSYCLALGIAIAGTVIGLAIGKNYRKQAADQLMFADHQQHLLSELNLIESKLYAHPQELLTTSEDSVWLEYEKSKFRQNLQQIEIKIKELQQFSQANPNDIAVSVSELDDFLFNYENTIKIYRNFVQELWQLIEILNREKINPSQPLVAEIKNQKATQIKINLEKLSERLTLIHNQAELQKEEANELFNQASQLEFQIISVSIILSVIIAISLTLATSQAIARPIQELTNIAQQSIQESNFEVQAQIQSYDEIGTLSRSFNQLIQSVKELLEQQEQAQQNLKLYNETLEHKVAERTQELSEKNKSLKTLLDELNQTQLQMVQSEKMSSLGQLVAGVAHEINNPINFIYGNLTHVDEYTQDLLKLANIYEENYQNPPNFIQEEIEALEIEFVREDLPKIIQSMKIGSERIREIVLSLRNFSRLDEAEFKTVDIHEGIDNTLLILQHRLKANANRPAIKIIKKYAQLPLIECYPGQLNQVFMNLLVNSLDALETEDEDELSQSLTQSSKQIVITTALLEQNRIQIVIADNGKGILPEVQKKLFDPFFTTKAVGKGTGLGLSISYQIVVDKHQGCLYCQSSPETGTAFFLEIPIYQENCNH